MTGVRTIADGRDLAAGGRDRERRRLGRDEHATSLPDHLRSVVLQGRGEEDACNRGNEIPVWAFAAR